MVKNKCAIVGSGPAALMAAEVLSSRNFSVDVFEKNPGLGRKILVAGSSGLNISNDFGLDQFLTSISSDIDCKIFKQHFEEFFTEDWIEFIEKKLGFGTYLGTSGRYFIKEMQASNFLRKWVDKLKAQGVRFHPMHELVDWEKDESFYLKFKVEDGSEIEKGPFGAVGLFLGGGSWEDKIPAWPTLLQKKGLDVEKFESSNVGYQVEWKKEFIAEAEGLALKNILLTTTLGSKIGDLMITKYGLEGTPIYHFGVTGQSYLDLKVGLSEAEILLRLKSEKGLSPIRLIKKYLNLCEAGLALLFHHTSEEEKKSLSSLVSLLKKFPVLLGEARPLKEAISSKGGVKMAELNDQLMSKKIPGLFLGGEMLNWDAPTGGFLIQTAVTQGYVAGTAMREISKP